MLKFGNKEFKNLQEQVLANANDILEIKQGLGTALPNPIIGPQGPQGIKGPQGPRGERGTEWTVGSELPASAEDGDIHLTFTGEVYQYENGWVLKTTIKGPQGPQGIKGPQGLQGETGPQGLQGPQGTAAPIYVVQGVLDGEEQLPDPETVPTNYAYIINDLIYGIVAGQWQSITSIGAYDRASEVSFNPTTDITSTNVQTAIEEVFDDSKSYIDGKVLNLTREINELKDDKLDKNGYSALAHVGLADNIASPDGITDNAEFAFRASGGTASIADGFAEIKRLKGRTWIVNQLVKNGNFETSDEWRIITTEATATWGANKLTITTTRTGGNWTPIYQYINGLKLNNQYYLKIKYTKSSNCSLRLRYPRILTISDDDEYIITANEISEGSLFFQVQSTDGQEAILELTEIVFVDSTKMFGAGKEPATVAQFNNLTRNINLDAYNEGTFVNMNAEALESIGFNAFDGELESGYIDINTGSNLTSADNIRSRNFIPVVCGETYTLYSDTLIEEQRTVYFYGKYKNYIGYNTLGKNITLSVPNNCCYIRFRFKVSALNHNICFHLTHSGYRNGQYEPYVKNTRTFYDIETYFPSGMRSAGSAFDEMTPKKAAINIGTIDLGTLDWGYNNESGHERFFVNVSSFAKLPTENNDIANITCSKYPTTTANLLYRDGSSVKQIALYTNGTLSISDNSYTDAATLKQSLSGVMLNYQLAETIIYDIESDEEWTYPVSDFGTEKAVDGAFLSAEIFYMNNLRDKLRNLPDIPKCSETGTHVLKCINGTYTWVEE